MLGFYPYPRVFWIMGWRFIAPTIVVLILIFTAVDYSGNTYGEYDYPSWANSVGWLITFSSVICIPVVALVKILQEEGSLVERVRKLIKPSPDWGPASPDHRPFNKAKSYCDSKAYKGLKRDIEGSNTTLLTNSSQSNMAPGGPPDSKDHNFSQLEPLKEDYEDNPSSEDEGLNMKVIIEDENIEIKAVSSEVTKNTVPTSLE